MEKILLYTIAVLCGVLTLVALFWAVSSVVTGSFLIEPASGQARLFVQLAVAAIALYLTRKALALARQR